jgi:hypothetical protein
MNTAYCIFCEKEVVVQDSPLGILHEYEQRTEFGFSELDWCYFDMGWASCPPPEDEEDWELHLIGPTDDEPVEDEFCILYNRPIQ